MDSSDSPHGVIEEWLAELKRSAGRPDKHDDGRNAYEITDLGREARERDRRRYKALAELIRERDEARTPAQTAPNWSLCPSAHCERREECGSPSDCTVRTGGRKALLPGFQAYLEAEYGGKLPPIRWDERYGGLPYKTDQAQRFRDYMAGVDAANAGRQALAKLKEAAHG